MGAPAAPGEPGPAAASRQRPATAATVAPEPAQVEKPPEPMSATARVARPSAPAEVGVAFDRLLQRLLVEHDFPGRASRPSCACSRAPAPVGGRAGGRRQAAVRARLEGFSLHANVSVPAHARARLEHLCRYLWRPEKAEEEMLVVLGQSS